MEYEKIKEKVDLAISNFLKNDMDLLNINVNERSISHKLAEHLQREFEDYHVDCEYNRYGEDVKRIKSIFRKEKISTSPEDLDGTTVYPDIVVHQRRSRDKNNLLVIEIKKSNNSLWKREEEEGGIDQKKLKEFTRQSGNFKYEWGLFVVFNVTNEGKPYRSEWFKNGKKYDRQKSDST